MNLKPNRIIGDFKEGSLTLEAWKNFQSRQGRYASKDSNNKSNGKVKIFVEGCEIDYVKVSSHAQVAVIKFLVDNSELIRDEILKELLAFLPDRKSTFDIDLPNINFATDFKNFIGLSIVHVLTSEKDDFAYVGFEFGCTWDEEHGLGVMTHKDRIIAIGQADKAFDTWVTYSDNGTAALISEKWGIDDKDVKSPWWKFWN
ncbi:DUF6985 domain-containing protein [Leptospira koniambonensis]|uniref:DUF6985 domain-containing protein n=1 Tax=Leptospira koniambonensis TaxID=2484950 RepID=UPI003EBD52BE